MIIDKIIYINLSHHPDRKEIIESKLIATGIPFERFSAIDGRGDLSQYYSELNISGDVLYAGTLGCFLSHKKAIEHISKLPNGNYIIMEDDLDFRSELSSDIQKLDIPNDYDFINLNYHFTLSGTPVNADFVIPKPLTFDENLGMSMYMLTPIGATKLTSKLSAIFNMYRGCLDVGMSSQFGNPIFNDMHIYFLVNRIAFHDESHLNSRRSAINWGETTKFTSQIKQVFEYLSTELSSASDVENKFNVHYGCKFDIRSSGNLTILSFIVNAFPIYQLMFADIEKSEVEKLVELAGIYGREHLLAYKHGHCKIRAI